MVIEKAAAARRQAWLEEDAYLADRTQEARDWHRFQREEVKRVNRSKYPPGSWARHLCHHWNFPNERKCNGTRPEKMHGGGATRTRRRGTLADDFSEYVVCPEPPAQVVSRKTATVRQPDGTREAVAGRAAAAAALARVTWARGWATCGARTSAYEKCCYRCWAPRPAPTSSHDGIAASADSADAQGEEPELDRETVQRLIKLRERSRGGKQIREREL